LAHLALLFSRHNGKFIIHSNIKNLLLVGKDSVLKLPGSEGVVGCGRL